jgi:amino acid transporter
MFNQLTPAVGIFLSVPAIFFAFDGFYSTAGIQSEMKEPKKVSLAMSLGLAIVSFLNVMISLSLLLCSKEGSIVSID